MFWIYKPDLLWASPVVLPNASMAEAEKLNTLTRLVLLITVVLFFVGFTQWWLFLIFGLGFVFILFLMYGERPGRSVKEHFNCKSKEIPSPKSSKRERRFTPSR